jgi:hypothetical protein
MCVDGIRKPALLPGTPDATVGKSNVLLING